MSTENQPQLITQNRPDPIFKQVTREAALGAGLKLLEVDFPQIVRADLILEVPEGIDLSATMFNFFRRYNVLEFKSQNDQFDRHAFLINEIRTALFMLENRQLEFEEVLNVFVLSSYPRGFLAYMRNRSCHFRSVIDSKWLKIGNIGGRKVAIVVCRDLPLDKRYFRWLLFAPSSTHKWQEFVKMLARGGELDLLEELVKLRPKEMGFMLSDVGTIAEDYSAEEQRLYRETMAGLMKIFLKVYRKDAEFLNEALSNLEPDQLLSGLTAAKRKQLLELLLQQETSETE